jgi:PhoPQ-activated pathogenicity-related protein
VPDSNNLNIFSRMMTPQGEALSEIVDPYRYLSEPKYQTMPKLMIDSTGDEFFVSDSAQFYFHDIPGSENYIRYLPNDGHGLDAVNTAESTLTFTYAILNQSPLPKFSWKVMPDGSIDVQTTTTPSQVLLWQATNPTARDFRHAYNPSIVWSSSALTDQGNGLYVGSTPTPATGATAFFVQLSFPSPIPNDPYIFTTEIHVNTTLPFYTWPYAANVSSVVGTTADSLLTVASMSQVASAVSAQAAASTVSPAAATPSVSASSSPSASPAVSAAASPAAVLLDDTTEPVPPSTNASPMLVDTVFGRSVDDVLG